MQRKFYLLTLVMLCCVMSVWADDVTYSPTLDVNFRTAAGNTAWQTVKNAAEEGNNDFELTSTAGFFALQKYTIPNLANATKLVLTLTVGKFSGVDAVRLWSFPLNDWTAETGIDDIYPKVKEALGVDLRATEGTPNNPLVKGAKVAGSDPAKTTLTISGTALATIKANASADGTFTLLLTNDKLIDSNNKRSYLSSNSANDEANRPSLVATIEAPSVVNATTGVGYSTLEEAFDAAVAAETDAVLEVSADQKLTKRLTLNKAVSISILPTKDITIKGQKNAMWFLVNTNGSTLMVGSKEHKITLDGISDDRSSFNNVDVARRENNSHIYLTNIEFKDFNCGANHLVGCKNAGGAIHLEDIVFTNCSSTDALVSNLREANDALYLKGFLNVGTDCSGTTIYTAKNRIRLGDPEGTTIYDDFSATNVITIGTANDNYVEGTLLIVKVPGSAADKFKPAKEGWFFTRTASNGDMKLTQTEPTGIDAVKRETTVNDGVYYNLAGQRVENPAKGVYIVNGKKVIKK